MMKQNPSNGGQKIAKRLAAYSAAAAATAVVTQGTANAAEVIWDIPDAVSDATVNLNFNLLTGATSAIPTTVSLYNNDNAGAGNFGFGFGGTYIYAPIGDVGGGFANASLTFVGAGGIPVSSLSPSNDVTPNLIFGGRTDFSPTYGNFAGIGGVAGAGAVIGVRFTDGVNTHFGWAQISIEAGGTILHGFGYNDTPGVLSHASDTVDVIPEPSSILMIALGAAGLGMRRRRKVA
jgi:hypothetical protein